MFILLPKKEVKFYKTALNYVKEKCLEAGCQFSPARVTADFEVAIHKAVREVFPETVIRGCRFHLGQSWFRKIQELGLAS